MMADQPILVVGLGSIGRRHIRNIKTVTPGAKIIVWRSGLNGRELGDVAPFVDCVATSLDEALSAGPVAALVTNPAPMHVETGLALAAKGIHLLIEKPLSNTLTGVVELLRLCHRHQTVLEIGYNFRFYRPLQVMKQALLDGLIGRVMSLRAEVGQYLPDWRPGTDYRNSVSAQEALGGGVVLELSHELDYVRWLAGEVDSVTAWVDHLSELEINVEDTAEIILKFASEAVGSIHLDMIHRPAKRTCRILGTKGALAWDWADHRVRHYANETGAWTELHPAQIIDANDMYIAELSHFLHCVQSGDTPAAGGQEARRVLEIALAAKQSSREGRTIKLVAPVSGVPSSSRTKVAEFG